MEMLDIQNEVSAVCKSSSISRAVVRALKREEAVKIFDFAPNGQKVPQGFLNYE